MIENVNASKTSSNIEYDIKKYIGVASINVVAVNPSNAVLRKYGWQIPDGSAEPVYTSILERDGKKIQSGRVRFLAQIMDFNEKPVIALDFWCRNAYQTNGDGTKFKIIDSFGRTAWATKEEVQAKKLPIYKTGNTASISPDYKACKDGEEEMVNFIMKYLNVTPYQIFDRKANAFVKSKNPGKLTIDDWSKICNGDVSEIKGYISMQPENRVKVVLGVRANAENNKTYQTFLNTVYIGNGASPDQTSGEYIKARKEIDRYFELHKNTTCSFQATPVKEWKETPSEVSDNSGSDLPDMPSDFDNDLPNISDDLPFPA